MLKGLLFVCALSGQAIACHLTKAKAGKTVLNTIPPKANVFVDGVPKKGPLDANAFGISLRIHSKRKLSVGGNTFPEVSLTPSPQEIATSNERQSREPSPTPLSQPDVEATKEGVVKRINALPGINAEKKANLIEKMNKARSMERLTVIPFDRGQTTLHRAAADELVKAFDRPEMRDKLSDPTTILVVAGYADTGGRADLNLRVSQERAENVSRILREQAKLLNATQTIGMGGTELLDSKRPDQNRAVEVWAVVPL